MNPLILIVEDNPDIQKYIKSILEHNKYRVITADNGKLALDFLSHTEEPPSLIISDIMMPEMDGYEFLKVVSNDSKLLHIPFFFLSVLDSPEEIRMGKLIGADDYLTKPINEDDLLASVAGKIIKSKKIALVNQKLKEFFDAHKSDLETCISKEDKNKVFLVEVGWDDDHGPKLEYFYPPTSEILINEISIQLYMAINVIYGRDKIIEAEGILATIENFKMTGYALFDSYPDENFRNGEREYMVAVIAPKITYYQSLEIKEFLKELSHSFKMKKVNNFKSYWENIYEKLSQSQF